MNDRNRNTQTQSQSDQKSRCSPSERPPYESPRLDALGPLHQIIRGATAKGVDMSGRTELEE